MTEQAIDSQPERRLSHSIAHAVVMHLQEESGDGDAHLTISDRSMAYEVREEILKECKWLKDCTGLITPPEGGSFFILLSDQSNENVTITDNISLEVPSWVGLRIRHGHWR